MAEDIKIPNSSEIDQALKEFEMKSNAERMQKTPEISRTAEDVKISDNSEIGQALKEFEIKAQAEETQKTPKILKNSDVPKIVQLMIKYSGGAIKKQRTAEYIILGFIIIILVATLVGFFVYRKNQTSVPEVRQKLIQIESESQ